MVEAKWNNGNVSFFNKVNRYRIEEVLLTKYTVDDFYLAISTLKLVNHQPRCQVHSIMIIMIITMIMIKTKLIAKTRCQRVTSFSFNAQIFFFVT